MSDDLCRCPVLRAAAEAEAMLELGLELDGYSPVMALMIARLRQERGCRNRNPDAYQHCPWASAMFGVGLRPRQDVPVLRGNVTGKQTGQFL